MDAMPRIRALYHEELLLLEEIFYQDINSYYNLSNMCTNNISHLDNFLGKSISIFNFYIPINYKIITK